MRRSLLSQIWRNGPFLYPDKSPQTDRRDHPVQGIHGSRQHIREEQRDQENDNRVPGHVGQQDYQCNQKDGPRDAGGMTVEAQHGTSVLPSTLKDKQSGAFRVVGGIQSNF